MWLMRTTVLKLVYNICQIIVVHGVAWHERQSGA